MEIEFKRFNEYIHVYKIEKLHNYLKKYEDELLLQANTWLKEFSNTSESYNFPIQTQELQNYLDNIFLYTAKKNYILGSNPKIDNHIGVYYQTNNQSENYYHNHYHDGSIVATTYLNPPKEGEGGEISFYIHEKHIINILPQPDLIYFFPGWLLHKPLPQQNPQPRFCFNWTYNGYRNPIHKLTGDRW